MAQYKVATHYKKLQHIKFEKLIVLLGTRYTFASFYFPIIHDGLLFFKFGIIYVR